MLKTFKFVLFVGLLCIGFVGCDGQKKAEERLLHAPKVDVTEMTVSDVKAVFTVVQEPTQISGTSLMRVVVKRTQSTKGEALFSAIISDTDGSRFHVGETVLVATVRYSNSWMTDALIYTIKPTQ